MTILKNKYKSLRSFSKNHVGAESNFCCIEDENSVTVINF